MNLEAGNRVDLVDMLIGFLKEHEEALTEVSGRLDHAADTMAHFVRPSLDAVKLGTLEELVEYRLAALEDEADPELRELLNKILVVIRS